MLVVEDPSGAFHLIAEGCDSDFLEKLPAHLAFSRNFLAGCGLKPDGTLEQLQEIEKLIAARQTEVEWHGRDFFQGLVAYCGELLRPRIPGEWGMVASKPFDKYPKTRHFPVIIAGNGRTHSFSASVEIELAYLLAPDLKWDKMDGLYFAMRRRLTSPDLAVGPRPQNPLPF